MFAIPPTVATVAIKVDRLQVEAILVAGKSAKKGKSKKSYGTATVAKPAVIGAGVLVVIQTAMKVFLKA
jgi:hypothetical protein